MKTHSASLDRYAVRYIEADGSHTQGPDCKNWGCAVLTIFALDNRPLDAIVINGTPHLLREPVPAMAYLLQHRAIAEGMVAAIDARSSLLNQAPAVGQAAEGWVVVPREVNPAMEAVYANESCAYQSAQELHDAMLSAAPAAPVADAIDPESSNFKEGLAVGMSCERALADKIANPVCDRCGACSEQDAASKCSPDGDACPGTGFPLSRLWELAKAAAPAVEVDDPMVERALAVMFPSKYDAHLRNNWRETARNALAAALGQEAQS